MVDSMILNLFVFDVDIQKTSCMPLNKHKIEKET